MGYLRRTSTATTRIRFPFQALLNLVEVICTNHHEDYQSRIIRCMMSKMILILATLANSPIWGVTTHRSKSGYLSNKLWTCRTTWQESKDKEMKSLVRSKTMKISCGTAEQRTTHWRSNLRKRLKICTTHNSRHWKDNTVKSASMKLLKAKV